VLGPAQLPATLVNRLNQEIARALNDPDVKRRLFESGVESVGNSPAEFAAFVNSEMAKWGKVIKEAKIREE
jgi:tripartite-type tricarboxylate transporter receptor subunit TctC